jgi:phospholipid transport system substrate-binding protein
MRRFWMIWLAVAGLAMPAAAVNDEAAKAFVENMAAKTLAIVKTDASEAAKQAALEDLFRPVVDVAFVGRFVLGQHWRTATPAQQKEYLAAYGPFLMKNYISRLVKYSGQQVKVTKAVPDKDGSVLVTMAITAPNQEKFFVEYRLRPEGKDFKLIDIVVEGVGLLASQRSEFNSVVSNKGLDYLIEALKKKANAAAAAS